MGPHVNHSITSDDHSTWDWITPICMAILVIGGVFFIYSAQLNSGYSSWKMQIVWIFLGSGVYLTVSLLDYDIFMKLGHWLYVITIVLLLVVISPLGEEREGAQRWINLGVASFQPSEVAKISVMVIVSSILARSEIGRVKESLTALVKVALVVAVPMLLILLQPDLGSSLVLIPMVLGLLFVSNLSMQFFVGVFLCCFLTVSVVVFDVIRYSNFLDDNNLTPTSDLGVYEEHSILPFHDYQRNRILTFIMPDKGDPKGIGWNLNQSLISVGSGGMFGKGLTEGTQAKLGYLPRPVAHNDFIFSVIAEEKGFIGSMSVLGLSGILLLNGIRIASKARDRFGMLLAVGVTIIFTIHIFINIGMTIGLMPITGLPLPFLSYGGSFLLTCCILQGIVQSVYRHRKQF